MYKITLVIIVISLVGCTTFREYKYVSGSVLANSDEKESSIQYDSLMITDIKSGYYYRIIPKDTNEQIDYNEIDWVYVSKENKVKLFTTANYEYCMLDMYWKQKPKQIYKQIKRNKSEFDSLYLKCSNQEFVPSAKHNNDNPVIILGPIGDIIAYEELLFIKGGLIRKIRNYYRIISMDTYTYVGK